MLHGLIFVCQYRRTAIFAYFLNFIACYTAAPYCNILVFAKISVLYRFSLGTNANICVAPPEIQGFATIFFYCFNPLQKSPGTKKNIHTEDDFSVVTFQQCQPKILLGGKLATGSTH